MAKKWPVRMVLAQKAVQSDGKQWSCLVVTKDTNNVLEKLYTICSNSIATVYLDRVRWEGDDNGGRVAGRVKKGQKKQTERHKESC